MNGPHAKPPDDIGAAYMAADAFCADTQGHVGLASLKAEYAQCLLAEVRRAFVAGWYARDRAGKKRAPTLDIKSVGAAVVPPPAKIDQL